MCKLDVQEEEVQIDQLFKSIHPNQVQYAHSSCNRRREI